MIYNIERLIIRFLLLFSDLDSLNAFFRDPENTALLIGTLIAIAGGISGCFLLLRGMSLSIDAISHTVLLGIVLAFMLMIAIGITPNLSSPLLLIGAAGTGIGTVFLTEMLYQTGLVKQDAALALVFTFLFALAIILISRYFDDYHLDSDAVMVGEIGIAWADTNSHTLEEHENIIITPADQRAEFMRQCINCSRDGINPRDEAAQFQQVCTNCGEYNPAQAYQAGFLTEAALVIFWPRSLTTMIVLCVATLLFIILFFKELKLASFDQTLASSLGCRPRLLHYLLMTLVSLIAIGAFNAVGSILVIAFFIIPPSAAYLLSDRLVPMLIGSAFIGSFSVFFGYQLAEGRLFGLSLRELTGGPWDTSISAAIVITMLMIFIIILIFSPKYGIVLFLLRKQRQRHLFEEKVFMGHILHHSGTEQEKTELNKYTIHTHIQWEEKRVERVLKHLRRTNQVQISEDNLILLTREGTAKVRKFWQDQILAH